MYLPTQKIIHRNSIEDELDYCTEHCQYIKILYLIGISSLQADFIFTTQT